MTLYYMYIIVGTVSITELSREELLPGWYGVRGRRLPEVGGAGRRAMMSAARGS